MKRIHIYLTEEQIKALDAEAARTGLKRSEIVRQKLADASRLETYVAMDTAWRRRLEPNTPPLVMAQE